MLLLPVSASQRLERRRDIDGCVRREGEDVVVKFAAALFRVDDARVTVLCDDAEDVAATRQTATAVPFQVVTDT